MKTLYQLDSYLLEHTRGLRIVLLLALSGLALSLGRAWGADEPIALKPVAVILTACEKPDAKGRVVLLAIDVLMSDASIQHFDKGDPNALLESVGDVPRKVRVIDCTHGTTS